MRIATWNVNSLRVRLPQLLDWLATARPDIVALQETKLTDEVFPAAEIKSAGYEAVYAGQKTYNGVALLARSLPAEVQRALPATPPQATPDDQKRLIAATVDGVRIVNVYVPNGQSVDSEKYAYKLAWLARLRAWLALELARHPQLILLGDFNIAPKDEDVHDPAVWAGSVLVSAPERATLRGLLDLGMQDVFRRFPQPERSYSWWDYRQAAFRRNLGLRIDLILASNTEAERATACRVDVTPRRNEQPSDHAPVVAEFD